MNDTELKSKLESFANGTKTELILASQKISDEQVVIIVQNLIGVEHLTSLNLANNRISKSGASSLVYFIETHPALENLNLCVNQLEDDGCKMIAEALKRNSTIKSINLSRNHAKSAGAKAIIDALAANPDRIESINLSMNEIRDSSSQNWHQLFKLKHLKQLDISHNQLSDKSMKVISQALTDVPLDTLLFHHNELEDQAMEYLSQLITKHDTLRHLDIAFNKLTDDGCETLADALESNPVLEHLNLTGNKVTDKGGVAIAESLWVNTHLKELLMRNTVLLEPTAIAFADAIKHNPTLSVFEHPTFPPSRDKVKDAIVYLTAHFEIKADQRNNQKKVDEKVKEIEELIDDNSLDDEKRFHKVKRNMSQLLNTIRSSVELNDTRILPNTLLRLKKLDSETIPEVLEALFDSGKFPYAKPLFYQFFDKKTLPKNQPSPKPLPDNDIIEDKLEDHKADTPIEAPAALVSSPTIQKTEPVSNSPLLDEEPLLTIESLYLGLCEVSARLLKLEQQMAALTVPPLLWHYAAFNPQPNDNEKVGQDTNLVQETNPHLFPQP